MAQEDSYQDQRPTSRAWQPGAGMRLMRVELYDSLAVGGSALAYRYEWYAGQYRRSSAQHTIYGNLIQKPLVGAAERAPAAGDIVYVAYFEDARRWEVIASAQPPAYIGKTAELIAGAVGNIPGCGDVDVWDFDPDSEEECGELEVTATTVHAHNLSTESIPSGTFVMLLRYGEGWIILPPAQTSSGILFTTITEMTVEEGAYVARAVVNDWWGRDPIDDETGETEEEEVIVHDHHGLFKRALSGAKGMAIWDPVDEKYRIVECQSQAGWILANVNNDLTISTIIDWGGTQQDIQEPADTATVTDPMGEIPVTEESAVYKCFLIYDAEADEYRIASRKGSSSDDPDDPCDCNPCEGNDSITKTFVTSINFANPCAPTYTTDTITVHDCTASETTPFGGETGDFSIPEFFSEPDYGSDSGANLA